MPTAASATAAKSARAPGTLRVRDVPPPQLSANIAVARVICICGIVYVHAWTGLDVNQLRAQGDGWHSILYWTLIEFMGRSSVPLLSIVSGWLVGASIARRSYRGFALGKTKSLLLPMVLWNVVAAALVISLARFGGLPAPQPAFGLPLANEIFHFTAPGEIDVQNAFLRDVFVCMLAAPLLLRLHTAALLAVLAGVAVWSVEGWQLYILLRPQILLFFLIGIFARRYRFDRGVDRLPFLPLSLLFLALGTGKCWLSIWGQYYQASYPEAVAVADNVLRIIAAMFFWRLSGIVARASIGPAIVRLERYTFLLFCSHVLIIWLLCPIIGPLFGRFDEPGYPVFLIIQPLPMLGGAIVIGQALLKTWPAAATIMSGGRLKRPQPASRPFKGQPSRSLSEQCS